MDITILELTFPNSEFNAPFSGRSTGLLSSSDPDQSADTDTSQSPSVARPIMVGLVILGLALLAKYMRGSKTPESTTEESQKTLDRL